MITIEEIIISSLYHRLVLCRIKKTADVNNKGDVDVCQDSNMLATKTRGLGFLSLGKLSGEPTHQNAVSPAYHSIETRRLEIREESVKQTPIKFEEEQVFFTRQVGRMINVGGLYLPSKASKTTTEVQTDPLWRMEGGLKGCDGEEELIDLTNCNEFSLARLESINSGNIGDESRSLLVFEPKMMALKDGEKDRGMVDGMDECLVRSIVRMRNEGGMKDAEERMIGGEGSNGNDKGEIGNLVGSYKVYNLSNDGKPLTMDEGLEKVDEKENDGLVMGGNEGENGDCSSSRGVGGGDFGGISEILKPSSYVDFVVNRIEADSFNQKLYATNNNQIDNNNTQQSDNNNKQQSDNNNTQQSDNHNTQQSDNHNMLQSSEQDQSIQKQLLKNSGIDFSGVKFHQSRECFPGTGRYNTIGGGGFKDRRRGSQRRSRSLRKTMVDGEKLLRHMMTCASGDKSSSDVITITDFKLSPKHAFRSLNSSHVDLRQHIDSEFNSPISSVLSTPANSHQKKSRSERSSPLMMTQHVNNHPTNHQPSSNDSSVEWDNEMMKSLSFIVDPSITPTDSSTTTTPIHMQFEKFSDWMKKLPIKLKRLPLNKIVIPGSHISLAIERDMKTSIDFSRCNLEMASFLHKLPNLPVFNHFRNQMKLIWRAWMSKQNLSVYHQLQAGSRYLDMRISKHKGLLVGAHGLYTGHLKRYLKEVRIFLEEQPFEVVIIHITPTDSLTPSDRKHLVTILFQIFGSKMAAWEGGKNKLTTKTTLPSIQTLLNANKQLLVVMPTDDVINHVSRHIFGGAVWADECLRVFSPRKQNLPELKFFLDDCLERIKLSSSPPSSSFASSSPPPSSSSFASSSSQPSSSPLPSSLSTPPISSSLLQGSSSSSYTTARSWFSSSSSTITDSSQSSATLYCSQAADAVATTAGGCDDASTATDDSFSTTRIDLPSKSEKSKLTKTASDHATLAVATKATTASAATKTPATINVIQAVLSPDMSTVFGKYDGRKSMRELSLIDTSPIIIDWLSQKGDGLNVVVVDFIGCPGLVASILNVNEGLGLIKY